MLDEAMKILRANEEVASLPRTGRGRARGGTVTMHPVQHIAVFDPLRWGTRPYASPLIEHRQRSVLHHDDVPFTVFPAGVI